MWKTRMPKPENRTVRMTISKPGSLKCRWVQIAEPSVCAYEQSSNEYWSRVLGIEMPLRNVHYWQSDKHLNKDERRVVWPEGRLGRVGCVHTCHQILSLFIYSIFPVCKYMQSSPTVNSPCIHSAIAGHQSRPINAFVSKTRKSKRGCLKHMHWKS